MDSEYRNTVRENVLIKKNSLVGNKIIKIKAATSRKLKRSFSQTSRANFRYLWN